MYLTDNFYFYFQSYSTRLLSACWWLFCTIILVLYIVSLGSAVNKINRNSEPDLNWFIRSEEATLAALNHGATATLLKVWEYQCDQVLPVKSSPTFYKGCPKRFSPKNFLTLPNLVTLRTTIFK